MVERLARMAVGPLALGGFFLPWAQGPSILASETYSGFELVGFAGRLQALDLGLTASAALWAVRLLILGVAIAAAWHTALAPAARWHLGYPLSGWYLAGGGIVAAGIGIWRAGLAAPPLGLGLWLLAGAVFVVCEVPTWRRVSLSRSVSEHALARSATAVGSQHKAGATQPVADAPGSDGVRADAVVTGR